MTEQTILGNTPADSATTEYKALMAKISRRLIPLLLICYIIAYIDRINVGFAKLQLREVLGVNENLFGSIYGIGAGLFFIGYFLFEIPSNLVMQRVGARFWIARIMIVWGIIAMAMLFIRNTAYFYSMRFLLGAAEAGFYPGVILYLTYWFPSRERARTIALFATGGIIAGIIGSPLSGAILELHGFWGFEGWQWLFLLESIPAIILGIVVLFVLPDNPAKAKWLNHNEKALLKTYLSEDLKKPGQQVSSGLKEALLSRKVWLLCLIYFLLNMGGYGYELWMPSIISNFSGIRFTEIGLINAIPYSIAALAMLWAGKHSDKTGKRKIYVFGGAALSAIGFVFSAWLHNPILAMVALTLAFAGLKASFGPFWALGTAFLSGTAAAGGIAFINSVGNLGGFAGPALVGYISDQTGQNKYALLALGIALLLMGILALLVKEHKKHTF